MEIPEILAELEQACFPNDFWAMSSICSALQRDDVIYRIEYGEDGSPVGYCIGAASFGEAELYRIGVLPDRRRKGIGKQLLRSFISLCPKNTEKIFLEVRESNRPAAALYESCGFKSAAVRKDYYGGGENATVMIMYNV